MGPTAEGSYRFRVKACVFSETERESVVEVELDGG